MHAICHLIRFQRAADLLSDLLVRWNLRICQGQRRAAQPVEMLVESKDATVVQAQALPDRVAALHDGVERADGGLVAMHEPAVDVDDEIAISLVERLEHMALP